MLTPEEIWQIEKDLSSPPFRGVPIGTALASLWHIEVHGGNAEGGFPAGLKNRARYCRHYFRPSQHPVGDVTFCKGRVLVTCLQPNSRCWDLVYPVVRRRATIVAPCCTPIRKRPPCCRRSSAAWRPNK